MVIDNYIKCLKYNSERSEIKNREGGKKEFLS